VASNTDSRTNGHSAHVNEDLPTSVAHFLAWETLAPTEHPNFCVEVVPSPFGSECGSAFTSGKLLGTSSRLGFLAQQC
jgi:hypothetical protein